MKIKEFIDFYEITNAGNGMVNIGNKEEGKRNIEEIKARKPEILAYFQKIKEEKEKARRERQEKINAIERLKELKKAIDAECGYFEDFGRRMEDEMLSSIAVKPPEADIDELKAKYPQAAAYIKAEGWECASNYTKMALGSRALERIINGENHEQVISEMEAEWDEYCDERMWD